MKDDINEGRPVKKILIGAVVAALVLFVVALWSGWIGLSVDSNEDTVRSDGKQGEHETVDLTATLDRTEIRQDAREAGEELAGLGDKAKVLAETETAKGRLRRVEQDPAMLTVAPDDKGQPVVVRIDDSTTFELKDGDEGDLDDLQVGDYLRVVFQTKDEVHWAHKITVTEAPKKEDAS